MKYAGFEWQAGGQSALTPCGPPCEGGQKHDIEILISIQPCRSGLILTMEVGLTAYLPE